jgi:MraZ protein
MLLGTYKPTLIGKNRIALPVKLRKEITGKELVLAIGFDDCIFGFEEKKWVEVTTADLSRPISDEEGRNLRRKMCTNAEKITLDSQGRFVIPETMMRYASVKDNLTLIGAGDHFEIWNQDIWAEYQKKLDKI